MEAIRSSAATPAEQHELGLRERKAAATRLAIVEALRQALPDRDLAAISADELAAAAQVSRVTFFNYFPHKRRAVDMLLAVLLYRVCVDVEVQSLRGVAAIEHMFSSMGDYVAESPHRIRRMFAECFADPKGDMTLTRAERVLLAPEVEAPIEQVGMGEFLVRHLLEAEDDGLVLSGSVYEMGQYLGSLLNGAALTGSRPEEIDYRAMYRRNVRRALGLLGKPGQRDPRPPRVPKRYRDLIKRLKGKKGKAR